MVYWPVFFDIETTGTNPMAREFWSNQQKAQVTAVGVGTIKNWDKGPDPQSADLQTGVVYNDSEYHLLQVLNDRIKALDYSGTPFLVSFNGRAFDHPYLCARYGRLRQNPGIFSHEWKRLDMFRVAGSDPTISDRYPSQEDYANALGVDVADPYDGSKMPEAFENGEWEKIKTHAEADVEEMMLLFLHRKGRMMDQFFDHYGIDAQGPPVEEVGSGLDETSESCEDATVIEEIELPLDDE